MSSARFWFVPLKDLAPAEQQAQLAARDEVRASDLPASYAVPSKLFEEGIRVGHVLALHDGDTVTALARVLALDGTGTLHWLRLPMVEAPELSATPELREVTGTEAQQFKLGIDAVLRDVPTSSGPAASPSAPAKTYTPAGPASNIILYGPPGTGKTYSVRRRALELLGAKDLKDEQIATEWERLRGAGQIVFCTFHQAFAYEEFVEGLRAITDGDGNVHYRVEPGVFKRLALTAAGVGVVEPTGEELDFDARWELFVSALDSEEERIVKGKNGGDYKLTSSVRNNIRAVRVELNAAGEYEEKTGPLIASRQTLAKVWADKASLGEDPSTAELAKKFGGGATPVWIAYQELRKVALPPSAEAPYERAHRALATGQSFAFAQGCRHYVLVIDEINRANIARVFGELITLLEPDKRLGCANELRVQLPASKEWFGVPPNLHVVGTMNTADRSIALMDVALRRRFTFEEMMPDASALHDALAEAGIEETLQTLVVGVFKKLNERLRYLYDREHQIGHAYFFGVRSLDGLRAVFADRILPLLQEYFYGQWDKVALALGYPIKADGAPKEVRGVEHASGTFLTTQKLDEKSVLGFDHDEYVNQVAWDVHPAFRPRGKADDTWLKQAFDELVGAKRA